MVEKVVAIYEGSGQVTGRTFKTTKIDLHFATSLLPDPRKHAFCSSFGLRICNSELEPRVLRMILEVHSSTGTLSDQILVVFGELWSHCSAPRKHPEGLKCCK